RSRDRSIGWNVVEKRCKAFASVAKELLEAGQRVARSVRPRVKNHDGGPPNVDQNSRAPLRQYPRGLVLRGHSASSILSSDRRTRRRRGGEGHPGPKRVRFGS